MRPSWVLVLLIPQLSASYCGRSGVPFSVEVLPSGAPVLGCAQPSCVAIPEGNDDDSFFQTDAEGQTDGFFREGDRTQNSYLQANKLKANCSGEFTDLACTKKSQWVGGLEYIDHPRQPLILQCCTFEGLRFSQDVGVTTIAAGEAVTGGEVIRDGRQISFDVIANVRKVVDPLDHSISYEVTVRRMNCLPDPPEVEVSYDNDVSEEMIRVLGTAGNRTIHEEKFISEEPETPKPRRKHPKKGSTGESAFGAPIFNPIESRPEQKFLPELPIQEEKPRPHPRTVPTHPPTLPTPALMRVTPKLRPKLTRIPTTPAPYIPPQTSAPSITQTPEAPPMMFPALPGLPALQFPQFPAQFYNPFSVQQAGTIQQHFGVPSFGQSQSVYGQQPASPAAPMGHNHPLFDVHHHLSPMAHQQFNPMDPFGLGQVFGPMTNQQNPFNPFGAAPPAPLPPQPPGTQYGQVTAGSGGLARPITGELPGYEEHPEVINPIIGQTAQNKLPNLYQAPPFQSLGQSLNNFRNQG